MAFVNEPNFIFVIWVLLLCYILIPISTWIRTHDILASLIAPIMMSCILFFIFLMEKEK